MKKEKRTLEGDIVKYPFSSQFQQKTLALMVRDRRFLAKHIRVIDPTFFDNPSFTAITRVVFDFYDDYGLTPSKDSLIEVMKEKKLEQLLPLVDTLYELNLDDGQHIEDQTIKFAKKQAIRKALLLSDNYIARDDFEAVRRVIDKAFLVGTNQSDLGSDYFSGIDKRLRMLSDEGRSERQVATFIPELDKILHGGIHPGELNIVMAPTGVGKSIFLVNMAFAALWQQKKVLFITLEMSPEKVGIRLDIRFTGIPYDELCTRQAELKGRLEIFKEQTNKLVLKKFPSAMATVDDFRALLLNLGRVQGFVPDLVIVDYLDIIKPHGLNAVESPYIAQGQISKELRGLASEFDLCLWTATQSNRGSVDKNVLTIADKADSFRAVADADVLIGLMRTPEEVTENTARLSLAKVRDGDVRARVLNVVMEPTKMFIGPPVDEIPW